jgi:hypothetical protein
MSQCSVKTLKSEQDDIYISINNLKVMIWKNNKTHMYLKISTKHKHKTTSVMEMGKHKRLLQWKPAVSTWATPTKGTEYLTAIQLDGKYVPPPHMLQPIILNSCTIESSEASKTSHPIFSPPDSKF